MSKNQNLVVRLITAFSVLPVILALVIWGKLPTGCLMGAAAAVCAVEYYLITLGRPLSGAAWVGILLALALPITPALIPRHAAEFGYWAVAAYLLFVWIFHLVRGPHAEAPTRSAHLLMGMLYGTVGLTALTAIRTLEDGIWWVVAVMVLTWMNDTLAYFGGRLFGRHKLYPEVSPNKTWEGFAGGMLGSVLGLFALRALFFGKLTVQDCLVMGVLGGFLGPAGDLCESMLKRAYGVKDSSNLVPGHGGMLDRVDALLFNSPMVFVYLHFVKHLS